MKEKLLEIKKEILQNLEKIKDSKALAELEIRYLGRKGEFTKLIRGVASLGVEDKKVIGKLANEIKKEVITKINEIKEVIENKSKEETDFIDVTQPGKKPEQGHLHPITQVIHELEDLFSSMGFIIVDGPELESDFFNFTALNIPEFHPARDTQDTFYILEPGTTNSAHANKSKKKNKEESPELVMRTHTSPVQIRAMQKYGAPIRCVAPGRVFRSEATDACHDSTFYQIEGLMVDENISIANFKAVIKEMLSGIFKEEVEVRIRPGYFPFVEPGLEVDMICTICKGKGCPSCKHGGWLEMMGAGMVHPRVLEYGGIDPDKYSGFAFGLGLDRLAMMRHGISDIRLFHGGDKRFLEQF